MSFFYIIMTQIGMLSSSLIRQGWQLTGQYAYWPDQWSLLVLTGHYWSIGGQLVDWKKLVDVKILGIIYPCFTEL